MLVLLLWHLCNCCYVELSHASLSVGACASGFGTLLTCGYTRMWGGVLRCAVRGGGWCEVSVAGLLSSAVVPRAPWNRSQAARAGCRACVCAAVVLRGLARTSCVRSSHQCRSCGSHAYSRIGVRGHDTRGVARRLTCRLLSRACRTRAGVQAPWRVEASGPTQRPFGF